MKVLLMELMSNQWGSSTNVYCVMKVLLMEVMMDK